MRVQFEAYQQLWSDVYDNIFNFVLKENKVPEDERFIDIDFPPIVEKDANEKIKVILAVIKDMPELDGDEWRAIMAANLDSAFFVTQAAARQMRERSITGAVVNIASIEGSDPAKGHSHYATSKAGLLMFTRACALEYGKDGIRFNSVSPGLIDRDGLNEGWPEGVERWLNKVPLGGLGHATDVANDGFVVSTYTMDGGEPENQPVVNRL